MQGKCGHIRGPEFSTYREVVSVIGLSLLTLTCGCQQTVSIMVKPVNVEEILTVESVREGEHFPVVVRFARQFPTEINVCVGSTATDVTYIRVENRYRIQIEDEWQVRLGTCPRFPVWPAALEQITLSLKAYEPGKLLVESDSGRVVRVIDVLRED